MMPTLKIPSSDHGVRLDVILARAYPDYSRSFLQKIIRRGGVKLQGQVPEPSDTVRAGDVLEIENFDQPPVMADEPAPERASQRVASAHGKAPKVIHEDASLLVIDKPAGLVVHP